MRSEGRIFQRGAVFWIAYYVRGKQVREPGGKTEKEAAKGSRLDSGRSTETASSARNRSVSPLKIYSTPSCFTSK